MRPSILIHVRAAQCRRIVAAVLAPLILSCSSDPVTAPLGDKIILTQQQASAIAAAASQVAPLHQDIAWLTDSIVIVVNAGAEANKVALTTDLGDGPFWAISLERRIVGSTFSFSTFDLIAFNNPNAPTDFIIVDGYKSVSGTTPATSVTGTFGTAGMAGHLFHVDASSVRSWRASIGTGTLSAGAAGAACPGFTTAGVTCVSSSMSIAFTITQADPDAAVLSGNRSASLAQVTVPGIRLGFTAP